MSKIYKSVIAMVVVSIMLGATACGSTEKQANDVAEPKSVEEEVEEAQAPAELEEKEARSGAIGVFYSRDGEYEEEISIFCSKDTDGKWEEWYKTGKADTDLYSDREGHVSVIENGTIETAYGEFKDFLLVDDRDDWGNSEESAGYFDRRKTGADRSWGRV